MLVKSGMSCGIWRRTLPGAKKRRPLEPCTDMKSTSTAPADDRPAVEPSLLLRLRRFGEEAIRESRIGATPVVEVRRMSGETRAISRYKHLSRGLDAIRDSRIASLLMALGTLPAHVRHQRFAASAFPRRLRAWRERNNLRKARRR